MSTTATVTPEEIQALELYLLTAPTFKYISLAALTLFTWDLVLTFPHEVRLWNARWTLVKFLFLLNRYFALGTAVLMTILTFDVTPTEAICSANAFFGVIALLLVANIEMILQLRLYALYGYDRRIVLPVSALFIVVFSIIMAMAVIVYIYEKDHEAQIFGACCIRVCGLAVSLLGTDDRVRLRACRVGRLQIPPTLFPDARQNLVWCSSYAHLCARFDPLFLLQLFSIPVQHFAGKIRSC